VREYLDFWRRYTDFKGKTTRRVFLVAIATWAAVASALILSLAVGAMFALKLTPEEAVEVSRAVSFLYGAASILPLFAMTFRRLRDAGYGPKSFLWLLIPVIGQFAFLARLCTNSKK